MGIYTASNQFASMILLFAHIVLIEARRDPMYQVSHLNIEFIKTVDKDSGAKTNSDPSIPKTHSAELSVSTKDLRLAAIHVGNKSSFLEYDSKRATPNCTQYYSKLKQLTIHPREYRDPLVLGSGGFGCVWKIQAVQGESCQATAAMKVHMSDNEDEFELARNEIEIWQTLKEGYFVQLWEGSARPISKTALYLMENVERGDLHSFKDTYGKTGFKNAANDVKLIFAQIILDALRGLQKLEEHNIIHRDIKPGNIFVTKDYRGKLGDFGLACSKTTCLHTAGSFWYFSPEVLNDPDTYFRRSDIWSLGVILYELWEGQNLWHGRSKNQILKEIKTYTQTGVDTGDTALNKLYQHMLTPCLNICIMQTKRWYARDLVPQAEQWIRNLQGSPIMDEPDTSLEPDCLK